MSFKFCNMALISSRMLNLLGALFGVLLIIASFYLEYTQHLDPCSLCILQRGIYLLLIIILLSAFLNNPKKHGIQVYACLTLLVASLGIFLAGRQVWLQGLKHAPAEICMPGFSYIIEHLPLSKALSSMLMGSDNCGVIEWRLLGWSMANWSLLCFILFGLLGIIQIIMSDRPQNSLIAGIIRSDRHSFES